MTQHEKQGTAIIITAFALLPLGFSFAAVAIAYIGAIVICGAVDGIMDIIEINKGEHNDNA